MVEGNVNVFWDAPYVGSGSQHRLFLVGGDRLISRRTSVYVRVCVCCAACIKLNYIATTHAATQKLPDNSAIVEACICHL